MEGMLSVAMKTLFDIPNVIFFLTFTQTEDIQSPAQDFARIPSSGMEPLFFLDRMSSFLPFRMDNLVSEASNPALHLHPFPGIARGYLQGYGFPSFSHSRSADHVISTPAAPSGSELRKEVLPNRILPNDWFGFIQPAREDFQVSSSSE
ncbi:hypothetical protein AVEN_126320-1 [Araneus ventricosus]|uniref:Uncharacterized protein n=1 Tax=Araneus ventricosus TaxID=182803 RepID=A0A4Y2FD19_ARAVE|nr:hypothetical protein AVEN_126320-1 [Araneus ventricosus]